MLNNGNTCYMNAILQPLCHCAPFINVFFKLNHVSKHSFKSETPLIDAMIMFANEFTEKSKAGVEFGDPFAPEYIYDTLRQMKKFDSLKGRQEDADEFLGALLDGLHEEFINILGGDHTMPSNDHDEWYQMDKRKKAAVTRTVGVETSTPISRIFFGKLRSTLKRTKASSSHTLEPFRSLHLDVLSNDDTVESAIHALTWAEELEEGKLIKQTLLEDMPPVLLLHLKRFVYDAMDGTQKVRKRLHYSPRLVIPLSVQASIVKRPRVVEYQLFGVVYHHGHSATGGHYTCDVLVDAHKWLRVDDTVLRWVDQDVVCPPSIEGDNLWPSDASGDAYLLFYVDVSVSRS